MAYKIDIKVIGCDWPSKSLIKHNLDRFYATCISIFLFSNLYPCAVSSSFEKKTIYHNKIKIVNLHEIQNYRKLYILHVIYTRGNVQAFGS